VGKTQEESFYTIIYLVIGLILLYIFAKSKLVDRGLRYVIRKALKKFTKLHVYDYELLLGLSKGYSIGQFKVRRNSWLANKKLEAIKNLNNALRKIEAVTHKYPELKLLPVSVDVRRNELITDINTVNKIRKEAYKALKNEDVQEARALLSGLSSEIDISSVNIPLATFPDAIKKAIQLVNSEKINEAQIVLVKALDGLVIVDKIIPIPILNAGVMIEEANRLYLEDRSANIDEVANLLENAEYQLKLSEALGYSKGNKAYKELARDIVKLKKSAKANSNIKEALNKLHIDIADFSESVY